MQVIDRYPYVITAPGTYEINTPRSITSSATGAAVTIQSDGVSIVAGDTNILPATGFMAGIEASDVQSCRVSGITIRDAVYGIRFRHGRQFRSGANRVHSTILTPRYHGIWMDGDASEIEHCHIPSVSGLGLPADPAYTRPCGIKTVGGGIRILDNLVYNVARVVESIGIAMDQGVANLVYGNTIGQPKLDPKHYGIWINGEANADPAVVHNYFTRWGFAIVYTAHTTGKYRDNTFIDCITNEAGSDAIDAGGNA